MDVCRAWRMLTPARASVLALTLVSALLSPEVAEAGLDQTPQEEQEEVRQREGEVALEIDALEAQHAEITAALDTLAANVAAQQAALADAEEAVTNAEAELDAAEAEVAETEARVEALNRASDQLVVDSFVAPPSWNMMDALQAENITDAAVMQAILDIQADTEADVLEELEQAEEDLEEVRDEKAAAADEAASAREAEAAQLDQLEAAQAQQSQFAAEIQAALDQKLVEVEMLKERDAELAEEIAAEAAAAAQALQDSGVDPAAGGSRVVGDVEVADATCPTGGTITVAASIVSDVQALLNAAGDDGLSMCGWGYRDTQRQIELRRQNCGTSDYAIYDMPSSQCSPATARPGFSQHEQGLAIDFTCGGSTVSSGSTCSEWLQANASGYGLYNLPGEPWHYSTTGN